MLYSFTCKKITKSFQTGENETFVLKDMQLIPKQTMYTTLENRTITMKDGRVLDPSEVPAYA
ncbi:hypothetical protein OVA29_12155 [Exiguobacterium sp. SL14]|nr:hypothetical protein [Exiguobacterium sp. SL14]MCY1691347.1 hypothetical protein [Exiguobacterium sp. SL14]